MPIDLPEGKVWLPPRPAIIRPTGRDILRYTPEGVLASLLPLGGFGGGGGGPSSLSFVASGSGTGVTITIPGTPTSGDLCVIWNWVTNNNDSVTPSSVVPSGFTSLIDSAREAGTNRGRCIISAKILTGSETTVSGMNDNLEWWIAATFTPVGTISTFVANGFQGQVTGGDPGSDTIAMASASPLPALGVGHMCTNNGQTATATSISPAMTNIAGAAANHFARYQIYNPGDTPSNITFNMAETVGFISGAQDGYLTFT